MTDGFFDFGKILLQSFKKHHGEDLTFFFTTRDLSEQQLDELHSLYKNLIVSNEKINIRKLSKKTGISVKDLRKYKWQVENRFVKPESVIWKQFISVEDRYRNSLQEAFNICGDHVIHMDVDSYINRSLNPLFKIVENNDVSLIFRLKAPFRMKMFGCLMGFKFGEKAQTFLETWRKHIDAKPLIRKPRGYGQTSCFLAYDELKKSDINWGRIPRGFVQPVFHRDALIVQGNNGLNKNTVARQWKGKVHC
jgi:hypothetical protein